MQVLKNNKNELEKTKILIDTPFLLPILCVDVQEEVYKAIAISEELMFLY